MSRSLIEARRFTENSTTRPHLEWDGMPIVGASRRAAQRRPLALYALAAIGALRVAELIISFIS